MFNKKAQGFGFIRIIFYSIFFLIMFALALAPFIATAMGATDLSVLGGFGAWAMANLALWIFLVFLLMVLIALVYGFGSE